MVYAAIFLFFAVPAMAVITYGRSTDRLAGPMQEIRGKNQQINTGGRNTAFKRNSGHSLPSTKESLSETFARCYDRYENKAKICEKAEFTRGK